MLKQGALALGLVALAGCAGMSDRAKSIRQTKVGEVAGCHFISRIDAGAVPHTAASSLEVEGQKRDALEAAASAGATHVVWDERQVQSRTLMTAGAYRCAPGPATAQQAPAPPAATPETVPASARQR